MSEIQGTAALMAKLLYGSGLRLNEALTQELLGHKDVSTTMIYCRVLNRGGLGIHSPACLRFEKNTVRFIERWAASILQRR